MDGSPCTQIISHPRLLAASFIAALLLYGFQISYITLAEHHIPIATTDALSTFYFTVLVCAAAVVAVRILATQWKKPLLNIGTLLLGCAMFLTATSSQAQETQYSKAAIAAYGDALGKYLAAITSLDLLSSGQCAYAFKEGYDYAAAENEGLSAFPADLRPALRQMFASEMKDQLRKFATEAQKEIYLSVSKNLDKNTACGVMIGMASKNLADAKDLLRQVRNPYFEFNPVFQ